MRRLLIVTAMLVSMSCASSGSIGEMRMVMQPKSDVWHAAVAAMHDIGATIRVSNEASGSLAGDVGNGELGGLVRIDVTVRPSAQNQDGSRSGSDISVSVSLDGGVPDDPSLKNELRSVKDEYLDAVESNLVYVRGSRGH